MEEDSWALDDGEALHAEAPDTFWIPSREARESLEPGALVKLVFRIQLHDAESDAESVEVERMWVVVQGRSASFYEGTLDNDPYCTDDLKSGAVVFFEPRHVINIWSDDLPPAAGS